MAKREIPVLLWKFPWTTTEKRAILVGWLSPLVLRLTCVWQAALGSLKNANAQGFRSYGSDLSGSKW